MTIAADLLAQNNALAALSAQAGGKVTNAVYAASQESGVDFGYLLQQASIESGFQADAKAKTSSATGLYQFIDSTWLQMIDQYGQKYGISSELSRQEKLDLRQDAKMSSYMAAEFAADNKDFLERRWGGDVGATELYLAHFMGAGGAAAFLKAKDANPLQPAAELFQSAANANKSIFYDPLTQRARTLQEVYDRFSAKFEGISAGENIDQNYTLPMSSEFKSYAQAMSRFLDKVPSPQSVQESDLFSLFAQRSAGNGASWLSMSSVDFLKLLQTAG